EIKRRRSRERRPPITPRQNFTQSVAADLREHDGPCACCVAVAAAQVSNGFSDALPNQCANVLSRARPPAPYRVARGPAARSRMSISLSRGAPRPGPEASTANPETLRWLFEPQLA